MYAVVLVLAVGLATYAVPQRDPRARLAMALCVAGIVLPLAIIAEVAVFDPHDAPRVWLAIAVSPWSPALGHLVRRRGGVVTRGVKIRLGSLAIGGLLVLATGTLRGGLDQLGTALLLGIGAMSVAGVGYIVGAIADLANVLRDPAGD